MENMSLQQLDLIINVLIIPSIMAYISMLILHIAPRRSLFTGKKGTIILSLFTFFVGCTSLAALSLYFVQTETKTETIIIESIEVVEESKEQQYKVIASDGTEYLIPSSSFLLEKAEDNTGGYAEVATYTHLNEDGTEEIKSITVYFDIMKLCN